MSTGIQWTDETWNPTTGCDQVSPGCDNCYALTMANRLKGMGSKDYQNDGNPATSGPGFAATMHPHRLDQPLRWKRPRRIFVNSMSDLFHEAISDEFIAQVFAVMALAPQHTFQVLTKRHGRMRTLLSSHAFEDRFADALHTVEDPTGKEIADVWAPYPLPNVWLGVSVEDQKWADIRIPALLDTPAAVRFLSCEPLLGPICLDAFHSPDGHAPGIDLPCEVWPPGIDWVIVGGESGPGARPMDPRWPRSLRDQCVAAGVAFHFKQWGEFAPLTAPESPLSVVTRIGKRKAGRELDGRTWDEWPA